MKAIESSCPSVDPGLRTWIGLDTGNVTTSLCATNHEGVVLLQCEVPTKAAAIHAVLQSFNGCPPLRVAAESCSTSTEIVKGLRKLGYEVSVYDCFQVHRFLSIRRNKTDTNDARGIAEVGRLGGTYLTEVHVKNDECFAIRAKLTTRKSIVKQRVASENVIRGMLRVYGAKIRGRVASASLFRRHVERQIEEIKSNSGVDLTSQMEPLLDMCSKLRAECDRLEAEIAAFANQDEHCRRFQEIPGVSAVVAVSFHTAIGDPSRFRRSTDVPAYLGLTPKVSDSGATSRQRAISKRGSVLTRTHLVNAASVIMHISKADTALKRWGVDRAGVIGVRKARVAVARKLSIILFSMWKNGETYKRDGIA
jgi:transposase